MKRVSLPARFLILTGLVCGVPCFASQPNSHLSPNSLLEGGFSRMSLNCRSTQELLRKALQPDISPSEFVDLIYDNSKDPRHSMPYEDLVGKKLTDIEKRWLFIQLQRVIVDSTSREAEFQRDKNPYYVNHAKAVLNSRLELTEEKNLEAFRTKLKIYAEAMGQIQSEILETDFVEFLKINKKWADQMALEKRWSDIVAQTPSVFAKWVGPAEKKQWPASANVPSPFEKWMGPDLDVLKKQWPASANVPSPFEKWMGLGVPEREDFLRDLVGTTAKDFLLPTPAWLASVEANLRKENQVLAEEFLMKIERLQLARAQPEPTGFKGAIWRILNKLPFMGPAPDARPGKALDAAA